MNLSRTSVANGFSLVSAFFSVLPLSCCVFPLAATLLGASGLAFAAALTPYYPYFVGLTVVSLAAGFYFTYRPQREDCPPGTACALPKRRRFQVVSLWVVAVLALALLVFPYVIPYLPL